MEYYFLVFKSLSVTIILGWNFQRNYVDTISPKTRMIKWDDGTSTVAARNWTAATRPAQPRRGRMPRTQVGGIRMSEGVTVGPGCIQAVNVCCAVHGVHRVREQPVQMSRRKVLLQNAIVDFTPDKTPKLFLTGIGDAQVHVKNGYVVGTTSAYNGPLRAVPKEAGTTSDLFMPEVPRETAGDRTKGEPPPPHPPEDNAPRPEYSLGRSPGGATRRLGRAAQQVTRVMGGPPREDRRNPPPKRGHPWRTTPVQSAVQYQPRVIERDRPRGATAGGEGGYRAVQRGVGLLCLPLSQVRRDHAVLSGLPQGYRGHGV